MAILVDRTGLRKEPLSLWISQCLCKVAEQYHQMHKAGLIKPDLQPHPARPPHPGQPVHSQEQVPVPTPAWQPGGLSPGQAQGLGKALCVDTSVCCSVSVDSSPYTPHGGKYEVPLLLLTWADSRAPEGETQSLDSLPHCHQPSPTLERLGQGPRAAIQQTNRPLRRGLGSAFDTGGAARWVPALPSFCSHLRKKHTPQTLQTMEDVIASGPRPVPWARF